MKLCRIFLDMLKSMRNINVCVSWSMVACPGRTPEIANILSILGEIHGRCLRRLAPFSTTYRMTLGITADSKHIYTAWYPTA